MTKLGRGLQSLIPPKQKATEVEYPKISEPVRAQKESIFDIEVTKIRHNPYQPRDEMDKSALKDLADSIRQHGILQPLIVTKYTVQTERGQETEYQLVAGHRRLEASKLIGLPYVPAIIRDSTEQQKLELSLVENLQRADLNAIERAKAFKRLQEEFDLTHEEVAQKVGKSREAVTNAMRLLNLPDSVQQALRQGKISEGHGRAILTIDDNNQRQALFNEILTKNLSVRAVETLGRQIKGVSKRIKENTVDPETKVLESRLEDFLGTRVKLAKSGNRGRILIEFYSSEELNAILDKILKS